MIFDFDNLVYRDMKQYYRIGLFVLVLPVLLSCGKNAVEEGVVARNSTGQVAGTNSTNISYYAAARFAEQVSFGATPELISEIQSKGMEAWIDEQFNLPLTTNQIPREYFTLPSSGQEKLIGEQRLGNVRSDDFWSTALTAKDQLRQRVAWAVFQYIPVAQGQANGSLDYYNMLRRDVFTNYSSILKNVTIHPMMGFYLNNELNRPSSPQCLGCAPNENYARELLQLFTIGVVQLNKDGSVSRDANGKAKESYSQKDVEELARALTGWKVAPNNTGLPDTYWPHYNQPMIPETLAFLHDSGQKTVMGTVIKAGMKAPEELDAVVSMLMAHQNIAPFVSLRLIQHLVMSNPSPQYISRVASVFRDNGSGKTGDMKAVIKAILLDPEARKGDQIGGDDSRTGYIREPVLWITSVYRGLGCTKMPRTVWQGLEIVEGVVNQDPVNVPSIFSFYQATDRAPGSNLLAPEQKLLNTQAFTDRLSNLSWRFVDKNNSMHTFNNEQTGCNFNELTAAFKKSPNEFVDLLSRKWFRGAMPATLRNSLVSLIRGENWENDLAGAVTSLQFAVTSPTFGVIK